MTVAGATYAVQYKVADGWFKHKSDATGQVYLEVQSPVGKQVLDIGEDTGTCLHECKSAAVKPSGNGGWHTAGPYSFVARATKTRIYFYAGGTSCPNLDVIKVQRVTYVKKLGIDLNKKSGANLVSNGAFTAGHSKWTAKCPPANYNNRPGLGDKCASPGGNWSPSGSDKALHMKNGCYQGNRMGWYQDITTVAGATYAVQYKVADGWFKHKSDKSGQVYLEVQSPVGKQVLDIGEDTGTCLHACKSTAVKPSGNGGWHKAGPYSFVARATKTRVYFYAGGTSCPNLDVIVVKRVPDVCNCANGLPKSGKACTSPGAN